ncbi:MAG: lytic murein transglycosylase [Alphaproteobacteria bacterium]|nr:lytic murein transglycosylase [Alphaproteobacteria bacterium]
MRFQTLSIILVAAFLGLATAAHAATRDFQTWLRAVKSEARTQGISQDVLDSALPDNMEPIARVLELDRKQPENTKHLSDYLKGIMSTERVERGRTRILNYRTLLGRVQKDYGVDKQVIVALWGIETNYGVNSGKYDVPQALATLAYDGRRGDYFRGELFKALRILQEGHIKPDKMKGSWAGAMGQSQFMPSSFLKFAQDFDRDGRRDIWTSEPDVFASAAYYLAESGWKQGNPWGHKIRLPKNIDRKLLGLDRKYSLDFWRKQGVRLLNGKIIPQEGEYQASVIQPDGPGTPSFIVYDNYRVILRWNRSNYFATAVCMLSDRLKG